MKSTCDIISSQVFVCLLLLFSGCRAAIDVALVEFLLTGNETAVSIPFSGIMFDMAESDLRSRYGAYLNFTAVRIKDPNVTICDMMDQKATFWATRYYYREAEGDKNMAIFGPGCPVASASVGHLARAWNKTMMIVVPGDPAVGNKNRYPTLIRLSPFIQDNLNTFFVHLLNSYGYSTVGMLCDDTNDKLSIYSPMCTSFSDFLRITYNFSASRYYVNAKDPVNVRTHLDTLKALTRGTNINNS